MTGIRKVFCAILISHLASCGSSGNSAPQTDSSQQYIKLSEYFPNQSSPNQSGLVELVRTSAGNGIISIPILEVAGEGDSPTESHQKWYVWSDNIDSAKQELSGSISIYGPKLEVGSSNNERISGQRYGLTPSRKEVFVKFESEKLSSSSPSEFVEIFLMNFGSRAMVSSGSPFSGSFPTGEHNYSGKAYVFEPFSLMELSHLGDFNGVTTIPNEHSGTLVYLCEFNMIANFDTNKVRVEAYSHSISSGGHPTYQFNGGEIQIDRSMGTFNSSNIQYEMTGSPKFNKTGNANIIGTFAGTQATGVHGMVYTDENSELTDFVGAFYGAR